MDNNNGWKTPDGAPEDNQGTYTFPDGRAVKLNTLGEALLVGLQSDHGKPEAPTREVPFAGGVVRHIKRGDDEPFPSKEDVEAIKDEKKRAEEEAYRAYRLELQRWNNEKGLLFARTIFLLGVQDNPTAEEEAIWKSIGWKDPFDIKYNWLAYLCRDVQTWADFIEAIMSYSMPTEEGLAEMGELFRDSVAGEQPQALAVD